MNSSDYSFKNNKPVPYGLGQFKRIKKHQDFMVLLNKFLYLNFKQNNIINKIFNLQKRIIKLVDEIDYAVERHANLIKEKKIQEQKILESRLKPKGQLSINNE